MDGHGKAGEVFSFQKCKIRRRFLPQDTRTRAWGGGGRKEVEREHFPLDLGWLDDLFNGKHGRAGYTSRSGTAFSVKKYMLRRRFSIAKQTGMSPGAHPSRIYCCKTQGCDAIFHR